MLTYPHKDGMLSYLKHGWNGWSSPGPVDASVVEVIYLIAGWVLPCLLLALLLAFLRLDVYRLDLARLGLALPLSYLALPCLALPSLRGCVLSCVLQQQRLMVTAVWY